MKLDLGNVLDFLSYSYYVVVVIPMYLMHMSFFFFLGFRLKRGIRIILQRLWSFLKRLMVSLTSELDGSIDLKTR